MSAIKNFWYKYQVLLVTIPALFGVHYGWYNLQFNETFVSEAERPKKVGLMEFPDPASKSEEQRTVNLEAKMKPPAFWLNAADWANKNKVVSFVVIMGTIWLGSYNFRTPQVPTMRERLPPEVAEAVEKKDLQMDQIEQFAKMSENSPGNRIAPAVGSDLTVKALSDPLMLKAITIFNDLGTSSYGPEGRMKVIHNNIGGHVTLTSSCDRLLKSMIFSNPIIKLIVSAVNGHLQKFHDGGLFIIILSTALIKISLASCIPRQLLMEMYETFLRYAIDILNGDFPCKSHLDFVDSEDAKALVRSVLTTKVGCCLFGDDTNFLVTLIFRAFLSVCPCESQDYGTIVYMTAEGLSLTESFLYEGVLIDAPHILSYKAKDWTSMKPSDGAKILVAVFSMSLSGDAEESPDAEYEIEETVDVTSQMLQNMRSLMDHLIERNVRLICCQKVIHPRMKSHLRRNKVTVLDRLGKHHIQQVKQVTGGHLIGSLSQGLDMGSLGSLDDVSAVVINQRTYLHLKSMEAQVSTLLLCHLTEEALEELKATCMKCEETLKTSLVDDRLLCGGGCWQSVLISAIETKIQDNKEDIKQSLDCSTHQLQASLTNFTDALKSSINSLDKKASHMTDTAKRHHWDITDSNKDCDWSVYPDSCRCGAIAQTQDTKLKFYDEHLGASVMDNTETQNKCKILDSFPVAVNAFQTAISVANLVLGVENIIIDRN